MSQYLNMYKYIQIYIYIYIYIYIHNYIYIYIFIYITPIIVYRLSNVIVLRLFVPEPTANKNKYSKMNYFISCLF